MADVKGMFADPEFNKLPIPQQKEALGKIDQEFSHLSDQQYQELRQKFASPVTSLLSLSPTGNPPRPGPPTAPGRPVRPDLPTLKEAGGMAVSSLPYLGAGVATALAPEGAPLWGTMLAAGTGAAAGSLAKSAIVSKVGQENLSGETFQVDPPPGSVGGVAWDAAKSGGEQALWELGGGLFAKGARALMGGALHGAARDAESQLMQKASEKFGLNLTGPEVVGDKSPAMLFQRVGEYSIFSQRHIRKKWGEAAERGVEAINTVMGRMYHPSSPSAAGEDLKKLIGLSNDLFKDASEDVYQRQLKPVADNIPINMRGVRATARRLLGESGRDTAAYPSIGRLGGKAEKIIQDLASGKDEEPFATIHNIRARLMQVAPDPNELMSNEGQGIAKLFVKEITEAMDNSLSAANPAARQAWQDARDFYKDGAELFQNTVIQGMLAREPHELVNVIQPHAEATAAMIRRAALEYPILYGSPADRQLAESGWRKFQEQFIRSRILGNPENATVKYTPENLAKVSERINDLGEGVINQIFGTNTRGREAVDSIKSIGDAFNRVQKLPSEGRKYVYDIVNMVSVGVAGAVGLGTGASLKTFGAGAGVSVLFEAIPYMTTRAVHNERFTRYLLDGLGGLAKSWQNRPMQYVGKAAIKLQEKSITSGASYRYLGKATADLARAIDIYNMERDRERKASSGSGVPSRKREDPIQLMLNEWR